ncbi:MAG: hypothetical protein AAFY98_05450 [Verrucomicrobiota bacterium]
MAGLLRTQPSVIPDRNQLTISDMNIVGLQPPNPLLPAILWHSLNMVGKQWLAICVGFLFLVSGWHGHAECSHDHDNSHHHSDSSHQTLDGAKCADCPSCHVPVATQSFRIYFDSSVPVIGLAATSLAVPPTVVIDTPMQPPRA